MSNRVVNHRKISQNHGWSSPGGPRDRLEKDGYEIYFHKDGFELTVRNPETMEREIVFEYRHERSSPLYAAILLYTIENVETVVTHA